MLKITIMILPIVGYGHPVLRKSGRIFLRRDADLKETIANV
jgi:peptide deformylase